MRATKSRRRRPANNDKPRSQNTGRQNRPRADVQREHADLKPVAGPAPETISLRVFGRNKGIVHVRVAGIHLRNILVTIADDGSAKIKPPRIVSRSGVDYGIAFALPPGQREDIERAIAVVWARAAVAEPLTAKSKAPENQEGAMP
jgi:hypothetical protein